MASVNDATILPELDKKQSANVEKAQFTEKVEAVNSSSDLGLDVNDEVVIEHAEDVAIQVGNCKYCCAFSF